MGKYEITKFGFTINTSEKFTSDLLLKFNKYIYKIFNNNQKESNFFRYIIYQHEKAPETGRIHIQGYVQLFKQSTMKRIKEKLTNNMEFNFNNEVHIEHPIRGSFEDQIRYCSKDYNRCKDPEHNLDPSHNKCCTCDYFDLSIICKYCNEQCQRIIAKKDNVITGGKFQKWRLNDNEVGPFEYGNPINHKSSKINDHESTLSIKEMRNILIEDNVKEIKSLEKVVSEFLDGKDYENLIKDNIEYFKKWFSTANDCEKLYKIFSKKNKIDKRWWKPVVIYIYGTPGAGKSYVPKSLFANKDRYHKDTSRYWNGYTNQKVSILDEFHGHITFSELKLLLDESPFDLEIKYSKGTQLSQYIFILSNRHPKDVYNFDEYIKDKNGNDMRNDKDYDALERRLDYIIKFEGRYLDDNVKMIIEKGNVENFLDLQFDIKYSKDESQTFEEYENQVKLLNINNNGEIIIKKELDFRKEKDIIYWRDKIQNHDDVKEYLRKINKRKINKRRKYSDDENDSDSSIHSDDSNYTKRSKYIKGKRQRYNIDQIID